MGIEAVNAEARPIGEVLNRHHNLKVYPRFWQMLKRGEKNFEVRRNDRNYRVGDVLYLQEFDPKSGTLGNDIIKREVLFILYPEDLPGAFTLGYVVLGL